MNQSQAGVKEPPLRLGAGLLELSFPNLRDVTPALWPVRN